MELLTNLLVNILKQTTLLQVILFLLNLKLKTEDYVIQVYGALKLKCHQVIQLINFEQFQMQEVFQPGEQLQDKLTSIHLEQALPNVVFTVVDTSGRDSNTSNNVVTSALQVANTGTSGNGGVITVGDGRADLQYVFSRQVFSLATTSLFLQVPNGTNGAFGGNFRTGDRVAVQFEITKPRTKCFWYVEFRAELTDFPKPKAKKPVRSIYSCWWTSSIHNRF